MYLKINFHFQVILKAKLLFFFLVCLIRVGKELCRKVDRCKSLFFIAM